MLYGNHSQYAIDTDTDISNIEGMTNDMQSFRDEVLGISDIAAVVSEVNKEVKSQTITEEEGRERLIQVFTQFIGNNEDLIVRMSILLANFSKCLSHTLRSMDGKQDCNLKDISEAIDSLVTVTSRQGIMIDELYANMKYSKSAFVLISKKGVSGEEAIPGHEYAQQRLQKKKSASDDDCDDLPF